MELQQVQQIQNDWRNANESAKSAYQHHQTAIQTYRDKQTAKNWYPDYDLIAQTYGAINQLQGAYNAMHQIAAVLYNEVINLKQSQKEPNESLRTITGYCTFKQAYWAWFIEKGLSAFASEDCPAQDKKDMIELMKKDVEDVPFLKQAIDFLNSRP